MALLVVDGFPHFLLLSKLSKAPVNFYDFPCFLPLLFYDSPNFVCLPYYPRRVAPAFYTSPTFLWLSQFVLAFFAFVGCHFFR